MFDAVTLDGTDTTIVLDPRDVQQLVRRQYELTLGPCSKRDARHECMANVAQHFLNHSKLICDTILQQIAKYSSLQDRSTSPAQSLVSLEWVILCLQHVSTRDNQLFGDLVLAEAFLAASCSSLAIRSGLRKAALKRVRLSFVRLLQSSSDRQGLCTDYIDVLTSERASSRSAMMLGQILTRVQQDVELKALVPKIRARVTRYFLDQFISSKQKISTESSESMGVYLRHFLTQKELEDLLTPAILKSLLRNPEIVIDPVLATIMHHCRPQSDEMTASLIKHFLQPLVSLFSSSDAVVRQGAFQSLTALAKRSAKHHSTIMNQLLKVWSHDRPAIEQRIFLAKSFRLFFAAEGVSQTDQRRAIIAVLSKENNEQVQIELIASVLQSLQQSQPYDEFDDALISPIQKGIVDKRSKIRNQWLCGLASLTEDYPGIGSRAMEALLPDLIKLWSKDVVAPVQILQNDHLPGLLALTCALFQSSSASKLIAQQLLAVNFRQRIYSKEHPFFLFSDRILSKISSKEDLFWVHSLLRHILHGSTMEWHEIADVWCKACLSLPFSNRDRLSLCTIEDPDTQRLLSKNLAHCTTVELWQRTESGTKHDTTSEELKQFLEMGMYAAFSNADSDLGDAYLDELLIQVMLAAHHSCLGDKLLWIELCQISAKDPRTVVEHNIELVLDQAFEHIHNEQHQRASAKSDAALRAITSIAFVSPSVIGAIVDQIESDLSCSALSLDMDAIGVWHTVPTQIFKDVSKPSNASSIIEKSMRAWQPAEWAQHIEDLLKTRSPPAQKLSKDEKSRIEKQQQLEADHRAILQDQVQKAHRGLNLIRSLNQPFIRPDPWFARVVKRLVSPIISRTRPYLGSAVQEVFLECSARVDRLGTDARLLGLATCAVLLQDEQINKLELVNRVLYRLRFESEKGVFDIESFVYAQTLMTEVLSSSGPPHLGRSGCRTDDQIEEQLFLVLEFLNHNLTVFADTRVARLETVTALLTVLNCRPSQAGDARTTLQGIFESLAGSASRKDLGFICSCLYSPNSIVRNALLTAADALDLSELGFSIELWLTMHDVVEENAELARTLFEGNGLSLASNLRTVTLETISGQNSFVQHCASRALAHTFDFEAQGMTALLENLFNIYWQATAKEPMTYDRFGQVVQKKAKPDTTSGSREAIALSISELTSRDQFTLEHTAAVVSFLFRSQTDEIDVIPLTDKSSTVRDVMLAAGNAAIRRHGHQSVEDVLPLIERALDLGGTTDEADWTRESAVILYGAAASFLPLGDDRVPRVIERLLKTLSTPSETVQLAIANRLAELVQNAEAAQKQYIHELLCTLSDGTSYAQRRGAAYGLAGVVRGSGVNSLQSEQIMTALEQGIMNKRNSKARQGSLLAYECFATILGGLWEPYIESIIPHLLLTFADTDADVRRATQDSARVIMSRISGYGVQSILPSLLSGLDDHQWRSKKGSVELIGAMAYCAPKQLSFSLPTIIPRLNEVLTDSHAQVRAAGNDSLTRFGQVIKNPEVQQLVPILLKALSNPNKYTEEALDQLLKTSFLHYIDSPSLSILIPILRRGMQERAAGTKKKSSKIFGLMASLTSPNDLVPHLASLMPCLRVVLVDTVPDVRATAAKALGSLVEQLGERSFPDLVEDLLTILNSDVASTDRQGAAQGLSEVLAGLGLDKLEEVLPRILKDARSRLAYVREGFISLLIYLPATFGSRFAPYLAKCISPILTGLADESEFVRDASLRAGKIMIANYATKSVDLMLPELERGMFNDSWRIRVSSLQLVGDLLFKVCGIATKSKTEDEDDDDEVATEAQRNALLETLGQSRRDRILSSLYICRFDSFALVRTSAINVWKTLVANTPKTLKDILPSLIEILIQSLSIRVSEKRAIFVETLGDLMRKLGKDLLAHLMPAFENGLKASVADRIGVCVAITEIVKSASPDQISELEERLVSAVKRVLIDPDEDVRTAANDSFETLQAQFGPKIIDRVLPDLLSLLQSDDKAEEALEALKGLMQSRSHTILPILLPGLLIRPMTSFNLQAISSLVRVAGPALTRRLSSLLTTILDAEVLGEASEAASTTFDAILLSISDSAESVAAVMNVMLDLCKHQDYKKRARACVHMSAFFTQTKLDYSRYVADWLRVLIALLAEREVTVVESAWIAQDALTKSLRKEQMPALVVSLRRALQNACGAGLALPGFSLPKGVSAVLPILLQGLLYGTAEQREESASGLGDVINRTDDTSLKVYVTQITGPLIRIIGERSGSEVKSAILLTSRLLIQKIPAALRPFLPQLQRTFTKSLADANEVVRNRAAAALGDLITVQSARIDPLVVELINGSRSDDPSTSTAMLAALFEVISKAGSVLSEASKTNVISLVRDLSASEGSSKAADLLGVLFKTIDSEAQSKALLQEVVLLHCPTLFSINALNGLLLNSSEKLKEVHAQSDIAAYLARTILSNQAPIAERSIIAAGKYLLIEALAEHTNDEILILALTECIEKCPSNSSDTVRLSLIVLRAISKQGHIVRANITRIGLAVFAHVRAPVLPVKLAAEAAFVSIFQMTEVQDKVLGPFLESLEPPKARSIGEYAKRVATKMATAENERRAAGIHDRDDDIEEIMGTFEPAESVDA